MVCINNEWDEILKTEFEKEYFKNLMKFLEEEYSTRIIYPKKDDIFDAMRSTSYSDTMVVILGQDPYHGENQAHGMAFSVKEGVAMPPSLVNIFKELKDDLGFEIPKNGCLMPWANEGVLLLNTVLTVRAGEANSHKNKGWETFTDNIILQLNNRAKPVIFIFWGAPAHNKQKLITNPNHYILTAPHPSPLSSYRGFFGCKHFSKANSILSSIGEKPINWKL